MRILLALELMFCYLLVFVLSYKKTHDIFSPLCFYSLLQGMRYIPGVAFFPEHMNINLTLENVFNVVIINIVSLFFVVMGSIFYDNFIREDNCTYVIKSASDKYPLLLLIIYLLGFLAQVIYIYKSGGLYQILYNLQGKDFAKGSGYLMSLQILMVISLACLIAKKRKINFITIIGLLIYCLPILIFRKRSPILEAVIVLLMIYHYTIHKFKLRDFISLKSIIILFIIILFIVTMPLLRRINVLLSIKSIKAFIELGIENILNIFYELSYTARDAFIYEHFNISNEYHGSRIINLIFSPIPSRLWNDKPIVDDGMYLCNYVYGFYIKPPSSDLPIINSYPFSTQGSLYAGWGLLGVIIGHFLLGLIYYHAYHELIKKNCIYYILIYQLIIYQLEFSVLSIVQTLTPLVIYFILFKLFLRMKIIKIES